MRFSLWLTRMTKLGRAIRSRHLLEALVRHRVLAGTEHRHVFSEEWKTVVDIGANRGQFALAAREYAPHARVIGFEPLAPAAAVFREVFRNDPQVVLHQAAIGPEARSAPIHVAAADDSSSLLPISKLQEELYPGTQEIGTETVRVGRLIDFIAPDEILRPALLKLDVQGFELEALKGCEDMLGRFALVYVECSFAELYEGQALADDVIAWLRERGFRLSGVYHISYDSRGLAVQGDFLFASADYTDLHR
mgnify:CR=1 FL=1